MERKIGTTNKTLCWDCWHAAGPDMCSWAREFKPVAGWKAKRTLLNMYVTDNKTSRTSSYTVSECPLFLPDPPAPRYPRILQ